jgi:hypothetical protein
MKNPHQVKKSDPVEMLRSPNGILLMARQPLEGNKHQIIMIALLTIG